MRARAQVIAGFADALRDLRKSVGNPPFREMSSRSGAISHTTLHEAAQGNRLPSWGTTVEFVKACGADPAEYRERWETADRAMRSAGADGSAVLAGGSVAPPTAERQASATAAADRPGVHSTIGVQASQSPGEDRASVRTPPWPGGVAAAVQPVLTTPGSRGRFRPTGSASAALAAAVVVVAVVLAVVAVNGGFGREGPSHTASGPPSQVALSSADCPVRAPNPAWTEPAHRGDKAKFIADITLPDCTGVDAATSVTKVWRLKNAGTVPWKGYSLRRLDLPQRSDQCQTISDVPIDDTKPGEMVDIRTEITTPRNPGLCYVRFKMVDASGTIAFPGSRPLTFQIIVRRP